MRSVSLVVTTLLALSTPAATLRLGDDVMPRAQAVSLTIDPARDSYSGRVVVDLDVRRPVNSFRLHAEEIEIERLELRGAAGAIDVSFAPAEEATIVVTSGAPLQSGKHTLSIDFTNEFDRRSVGLYKTVRRDTPYVFTQFQAIDARKAFPAWDEPAFKIPYQLTVQIPESLSAVFNTPVLHETSSGDWKTIVFAPTKPVPAYMLAIAVGDFEFTPIPNLSVPGRVVTVRGQSALARDAVQVTPRLLASLEEWFRIPYPYEKLDLIAVPEFWPGAMENPGAITFAEGVLLIDPEHATASQRRTLISITAHELAHMWFGDYVTMEWWDDFWLNESFADWMADKITQQVFPELGQQLSELQNIHSAMAADARPSSEPIRKRDRHPREAIGSVYLAYNKGKAILSMFEQWLGEEVFRAGVNRYLRANAWGNAAADDLWAALAAEGNRKAPAAMTTFLEQPGLPLITVERLTDRTFKVSQTRFEAAGVDLPEQKWLVPVAVRHPNGVHTFLLERASQVVRLPSAAAWIHPNADSRGYYHWSLPGAEMELLARRAGEVLTPRERLGFVANLSPLFASGTLSGDRYLTLLSRFGNDERAEVVSAVAAQLARLDAPFGTGDTAAAYSAWVRSLLRPALDRVGFEPRAGEPIAVTSLRRTLIERLGRAGDEQVVRFAREAAKRYLDDPASLDPSLITAVLGVNAASGDLALFEEYRKRFEAATVPADRLRYLLALTAFHSPQVRARALEYALAGPLRPAEILTVPRAYLDTPESRDAVVAWLMANHDVVRKRIPPIALGDLATLARGCEPQRVERLRTFFGDPGRRSPVIDRELSEVAAEVAECVALRQREGTVVQKYLHQSR